MSIYNRTKFNPQGFAIACNDNAKFNYCDLQLVVEYKNIMCYVYKYKPAYADNKFVSMMGIKKKLKPLVLFPIFKFDDTRTAIMINDIVKMLYDTVTVGHYYSSLPIL